MENLNDFVWQEQQGRFQNDEPFHEWTFSHVTGRLAATVRGPSDRTGGFNYSVLWLFNQPVMMREAPFEFLDWDAAKRFIEEIVQEVITEVTPGGVFHMKPDVNPMLKNALMESMSEAAGFFRKAAITPEA